MCNAHKNSRLYSNNVFCVNDKPVFSYYPPRPALIITTAADKYPVQSVFKRRLQRPTLIYSLPIQRATARDEHELLHPNETVVHSIAAMRCIIGIYSGRPHLFWKLWRQISIRYFILNTFPHLNSADSRNQGGVWRSNNDPRPASDCINESRSAWHDPSN